MRLFIPILLAAALAHSIPASANTKGNELRLGPFLVAPASGSCLAFRCSNTHPSQSAMPTASRSPASEAFVMKLPLDPLPRLRTLPKAAKEAHSR